MLPIRDTIGLDAILVYQELRQACHPSLLFLLRLFNPNITRSVNSNADMLTKVPRSAIELMSAIQPRDSIQLQREQITQEKVVADALFGLALEMPVVLPPAADITIQTRNVLGF